MNDFLADEFLTEIEGLTLEDAGFSRLKVSLKETYIGLVRLNPYYSSWVIKRPFDKLVIPGFPDGITAIKALVSVVDMTEEESLEHILAVTQEWTAKNKDKYPSLYTDQNSPLFSLEAVAIQHTQPKEKTSSLSSMLADVAQLIDAIETAQSNGDFESVEQGEAFLDRVIRPALAEKTDAIAFILQVKLPAIAAERKAYLETVQDWARQPEAQMKSLKAYLKTLWQTGTLEGDELSGHQHSINFSTMTRPTISVDQQVAEQDWSPEEQKAYGEIRVEFKPIKANIEAALKQNKPLPPGVDVTYSSKLSIKMKK